MKINRLLAAALIIIATVFTGCVKESVWERNTGIDSSKAAPEEFTFDVNVSSKNELAVHWDGQKAKAAGAKSFTVQLTDSNNADKGNNWDSKLSKLLQISDDPTAKYEETIFEGLTEGAKYYVRVRANYPGSVYSEWVYVASPSGKPMICEVGFGPTDTDAVTPESLTYVKSKETETSMTFDAVATAATEAGASKLIYRLTNYETGLSEIKEVDPSVLSVTFKDLDLKSQHKAYVAALYEREIGGIYYSNWVAAAETIKLADGSEVVTNLFEAGTGAVEDKGVRPRIALKWATSSELGVQWTSTAFANPTADFEYKYNIQLFEDNACEKLIVSWTIDDARGSGTQKRTPEGSSPRFLFSGLTANTTYYARVINLTTNMVSSPVEMKTAEFTPVTISSTPAVDGDIILAEDFSELIWGSNMVYEYPGYSANNRNKVPFVRATGENPVGGNAPTDEQKAADFYLVDSSVEIGFFNTLKPSVPFTRLETWGLWSENGKNDGKLLARPGHLKLGASSYIGRVVTPVLSSLSDVATLELTFKAALYSTDETSGAVWVVNGPLNNYLLTEAEGLDAPVHKFELGSSSEWTEHTVKLRNVSPESRIMIGNLRTDGTVAGSDQQRMFLDDVVVKLISYGGDAVDLVPPTHTSITLTTAPKQITATWNAVDGANGYVLAYKKSTEGDDAWTEVALGKKETTYTIEGLKELTTYEIKVKATAAGGQESDWSSIVSATTPKNPAAVKDIATAAAWIEFITGDYISSATDSADDVITLTADLDFTGIEYPGGAEFRGVINGNGKTIKNLVTSVPMFKSVTSVKDLTFDASCSLTATVDGKYAMVAEVSNGLVSNVVNNANVTVNLAAAPSAGTPLIAAGIVAEAEGDLVNCTNNGAITVNSTVGLEASLAGGICGYASTKITGCTNNGKVSQNSTHFIVKSWCTYKDIAKVPQHTGGIAVMTKAGSIIENCTNNGNVVLNMSAIEMIGKSAGTNRIRIGGIVAAPKGDIKGCTNKGKVECYAKTSDRSRMSVASKAVSGSSMNYSVSPGGITGGAYDAGDATDVGMDVINCVNEGDVIVDADVDGNNSTVGGIVSHPGYESSSNTNTMENCINRGNITVTGKGLFRVGGINGGIGNVVGCENYGVIKVATSEKAGSSIAGIAGFMNNGNKFENNKNYGDVVSESNGIAHSVSGLIGGVGNTNGVSYGTGCIVKCNVRFNAESLPNSGMVLGVSGTKADPEPIFGSAESPIKVSGSFNGTAIDASNVVSTAKGSSAAQGVINVVLGE